MDDEEGPWVAVYYRHHHKHQDSFQTSHEAWACLYYGEESGTLAGHSIIDPDGFEHLDPDLGGVEAIWKLLETNSYLIERDGMTTLDGRQGLLEVPDET